MAESKKAGSRSNLYRSRRKLLKSFDNKNNVFTDGRSLPDNWEKPTLKQNSKSVLSNLTPVKLRVSANPAPGSVVQAGKAINELTLHINPHPGPGATAEFRVHCGNKIDGPFTLPVDSNGTAIGFIYVAQECETEKMVSVEWFYLDQSITAEWIISI